tara:strand:- start:110 stop:298 length:189 start_codon:yes stop_codon:yes gene_type:complete
MAYHSSDKKKPKMKSKKQSMAQKLKEHSSNHSPKHMAMMRRLIKGGASFTSAHRQAQKSVGK